MKPGSKVSEYIGKVEFIARKLRDAGVVIEDDTLISKIVSGLSDDYKHLMSNWLSTSVSDRTYSNLLPRLLAEEAIIGKGDDNHKKAVAMKANSGNNQRNNQRNGPRRPGDTGKGKSLKDVECYNCGKKGHVKKFCRAPKKDKGAKPGQNQANTSQVA